MKLNPNIRAWLQGPLLALIAGGLFPLAFAPFDQWWLGLISLVILIHLVDDRNLSIWACTLRFYLFAVGMYAVGISWIYVSINRYGGASPVLAASLVLLFVLAYSLHGLIQGYVFARWLRFRRFMMLLGFVPLWILQEWVRTWLLTGFPWLLTGYAGFSTPLAGFAPVAGVLGVSAVFLISAILLRAALLGFWRFHRQNRMADLRQAGAGLAVLIMLWGVGFLIQWAPFVQPTGEKITVSAVQGNVAQESKWHRDMVRPILDLYTDSSRREFGRDVIVWPEAAITLYRDQALPFLRNYTEAAAAEGTAIVTGLPDREGASGRLLNTAVALGNGSGQYVKRRLVPFGEYVPLENQLRGLITFFDLPMSRNVPGAEDQGALAIGDLRASVSICYEVVYPDLVRTTADNPDFFVTISNDTWFGHSVGPWQHLQMARMRALENGRPMVRATNNGITALIDHQGRLLAVLPQFEQGVLRGELAQMSGTTPFHQLGHAPTLGLSLILMAIGLLLQRLK